MAKHGLCSYLVDPDPTKLFRVSPVFIKDMQTVLGNRPLLVRVPISAGPDNSFPTQVYRQALDTYAAAGAELVGIAAQDFNAGYLNQPLGTVAGKPSDPTLNDAIQAYTLRLEGVCKQLVPHGLKSLIVWNEPNLNDQIAIGVVPPACKPTSLSPEVFGSLVYQGAHRAKAAGITRVYAGALSCLERFGTNPAGDWEEGYLDKALGYIARHGKQAEIDMLGYNMEGVTDATYALKAAQSLNDVAQKHSYTVGTYVGEWSWQVGSGVNVANAAGTFHALDAAFDEVYFFQYPFFAPHTLGGYGMRDWSIQPLGQAGPPYGFYPFGIPSDWYYILQRLYASA